MLNNILNLDGVTVLDKKQQKEVNGGMGYCIITTVSGGGNETAYIFGLPDDAASQTSAAQNACGQVLTHEGSGSRCFYDCSHDGIGQ